MSLQASLDQMVAAQMLRRLNQASAAGAALGDGYVFKHGLTQEAAYRSLPRRQRELIHRRVARCYETLFVDRLDEQAAVLAHHYGEAGDAELALSYSLRAGMHAMATYASAEALLHLDRAMAIVQSGWPAAADQVMQLFSQRGLALELESRFREAEENYRALERLAAERHDRRLELAAVAAQTKLRSYGNQLYDPVEGEMLARRALALAEELGDRRSQAEIYWNLMNQARFDIGRLDEAIVAGEHALEIARAVGWKEQIAYILNDIADVYADTARYAEGIAALTEARHLWQELGNLPMLADNLISAGIERTLNGDFPSAGAFLEDAFAISTRIRNVWGQAFCRAVRGMMYWQVGRYDLALEDFTASPALAREAGFLIGQILPRVKLALLSIELGSPRRALDDIGPALATDAAAAPQIAPMLASVSGAIMALNGRADEAGPDSGSVEFDISIGVWALQDVSLSRIILLFHRQRYEAALTLIDRHARVIQAREVAALGTDCDLFAGRALLALGRPDEARGRLNIARATAEAIGQRRILWQVLPLLADLTPDPLEAAALRAEAAEIMRDISGQLADDELRTAFLALPDVERTLREFDHSQGDSPHV